MSRFRTFHRAEKGQIYASLWIEFHVDCASEGCEEHVTVAELGHCEDVQAAQKLMKECDTADNSTGWVCKKRRWYCPKCAKGA